MCIGIPMEVLESHDHFAICRSLNGQDVRIDTLLVGSVESGNWLLTFLDTAREIISTQQAHEIQAALQGIEAATQGNSFEHLFADLINREPQLPDFLQPASAQDADQD